MSDVDPVDPVDDGEEGLRATDRCDVDADDFARTLGHRFDDVALLELALTHRSRSIDAAGGRSNERLEFLGDAVLSWVVADLLYRLYPDAPEGVLNNMRKVVVYEGSLAEVARGVGLGRFILLGRGEEGAGGRDKNSILADAMEAVIGAVYLDAGAAAASDFIGHHFAGALRSAMEHRDTLDYKSTLQERQARAGLRAPIYDTTGVGPDHDRTFTSTVTVAGAPRGTGSGSTKREAEQNAAREALREMDDD